jgi:hypothetical protein
VCFIGSKSGGRKARPYAEAPIRVGAGFIPARVFCNMPERIFENPYRLNVWIEAVFSFDVESSTFDVGRSLF